MRWNVMSATVMLHWSLREWGRACGEASGGSCAPLWSTRKWIIVWAEARSDRGQRTSLCNTAITTHSAITTTPFWTPAMIVNMASTRASTTMKLPPSYHLYDSRNNVHALASGFCDKVMICGPALQLVRSASWSCTRPHLEYSKGQYEWRHWLYRREVVFTGCDNLVAVYSEWIFEIVSSKLLRGSQDFGLEGSSCATALCFQKEPRFRARVKIFRQIGSIVLLTPFEDESAWKRRFTICPPYRGPLFALA